MFGPELPLDRAPYECSGAAVLSWTDPAALAPHDFEQIALRLTGHARAIAADVRHRADILDEDTGPRALAEIILAEAQRRLSALHQGTLRCVRNRARLVRALYDRLDRPPGRPGRRDRLNRDRPQADSTRPRVTAPGVALCTVTCPTG
ncbi:DUF6415 family natural product biosynthesis protein [Streptomyces sp. NBC_01237]|nr:DUF6415 family natural product biosynthesis protein [Streptomyces sp. NBC_01237]